MTSETSPRSIPRSSSADPWYNESPKASRPQSPSLFLLAQIPYDEQFKQNSLVTRKLLNNVTRIEDITNSLVKDAVISDLEGHSRSSDASAEPFCELADSIAEIEGLVKSLQAPPHDKEGIENDCFTCVSLKCELDSMRSRITGLEKELVYWKGRVDELSTTSGKATPPPTAHVERAGPSPLLSASMRLKSVTAALNKALHARK